MMNIAALSVIGFCLLFSVRGVCAPLGEEAVYALGSNITESLLNDYEPSVTVEVTRTQISRLIYDARTEGAKILRWLPTDVWPQWRCSSDPEDADGDIDPAWFEVTAALLRTAQDQDIKVVISLSDLAGNSFASMGPKGPSMDATLERWAQHRQQAAGYDRYPAAAHSCDAMPPYYSHAESDLFSDTGLRARFLHRMTTMARYLAQFPGLGGIELFNEPDFALTHTPDYWRAVATMLKEVKASDPALANVPVYSGTTWWDAQIVAEAKKAGALDLEPFITVHAYDDYTRPERDLDAALNDFVDYLHRLVPDKPVIIAEAGSKVPLTRLEDNAKMIRVLLRLYRTRHIGLWVWGDWFPAGRDVDYKWDFNPRSAAGPSLAPFFFSSEMAAEYAAPRRVAAADASGRDTGFALSVEKTQTADPIENGVWSLRLDSRLFLGFSRAGAFPRRADPPEKFAAPPPTYFTFEGAQPSEWATISQAGDHWRLDLYRCAGEGESGLPTPGALLGLVAETRRRNFGSCDHSISIADAEKM